MVGELFDRLKKLPKREQESFLVIEDLGFGFGVTRAKIRNKDKKINVYGTGFVENFEGIKKPLFPVDKVILAVGSDKAVTIESTIHLKRSEPDEPISETEIDTLVFRGLWEFLNRYRGTVSKKLGAHDLDLILAGAEIREVSLGQSRVFNPQGFKGANLYFRYRGTFIHRDLEALIEKMEHWGREKILVESGGILGLSVPPPSDYFVLVGDKATNVFANGEEDWLHLKVLPWGSGLILRKIAVFFGVSTGVAAEILLSLDKEPPSGKIKKAIEGMIREEIQNLLKLLPRSGGRGRQPDFYFGFNLPSVLVGKFLGPRMKLVNFKNLLTEQGYGVIMNQESAPFLNADNVLAFITHVYSPPQYGFLNDLLARRARWLTAKH
ncbi:hypothetical protein A2116_01560 [Candidatus Jorgensenbacteria bacterium GWA1_49_17]|uniref:Uncharacterized protein n=1 Tax=Candidatus Jorgensenbacteria bacterium GWA1_49_17 TaxID=1798467 RepID=A0A1F6BTS9_9BACT|nr:MAG: hypothetical protein A2116_01560 [Candidatus Jorgensenbacteria bacterium GWA1_49_17]